MPGLSQKSGHHIHTHSSSTSTSSCGGSATNAKDAIWSCSRDHVTYAQLYKFWSELPSSSRQELLRIDKQTLFEQVRKNLYCSRCNGLLLEVFSQIVLYGKNIHQEAAYAHALCGQPQNRNHIENGSKLMAASTQDDTSDPSVHPWGGLATTRDSVLTLLDCFLIGTSLEALQNVFDSGRARERERELLYPDACGGGGRGWISQGTSTSGRGHGMKETCALHTARLSCEALVDFWSALGEETRLSLLRLKEEDFIERLMFRFDSKRFCRDCRRNVLREFKELKELKRTRREPRCTTWFCVADTAFQYEVSDCTVQADWHECFAEAGGIYHHFEWAVGTGEGKSDILGFEDVGLSGSVQADGLELDNITACFITLRAWKHDGRCTELSVKAHALEGRLCVHRRLIVGDGFVTITKGESIRRFFEHAEETEEEEDEDSTDKEGNDLETEGLRPQKHAKSPELARDFLLDAATVIFKEQVEKAFREGTARQNAHSIFVCLALGLLEERVHVACKEIITLEKQKKLLEEEAAEKREEEERKERKRLKEREKKLRRKEKLKEKEREKEKNSVEVNPVVLISQKSANGSIPTEQEESACHSGDGAGNKNDDTVMARSSSPDMIMATSSMHYVLGENRNGKEHDMSFSVVYVDGEFNARDGNGSFIVGQSKSARRKSKIRKSPMLETASGRLFRRGPNMSLETHSHVRSSERPASHGYFETSGSIHSFQKHSKSLKPDNFGKADNRNSTTKCHEKYHWSNGRSHYRYDYQLCGCSTHSFDKSVRESRITDKSDATYDMPKPFYRIGSHMAGPILDHGVHKGKNSAGVLCGSRGDMVSHKKVWEPLELRRQANRSPSQCSVPLNSITSKAAACEKGDTFNRKIIQCSNKLNTMHNNNNNNNNNNVSVASISTNEWSPLSSCISNGSDKKSRISNSHHSESDATSEGLVQEIHNDSGQKTKSSLSVPLFNGNHINDSASCISAADDCCRQSRDNNGCIVMPSSYNISEKPKDTMVAGDSSSASENGCQYGDVKISNKCGTDLQVPCSNPGSIENFDRHRSGSQLGTACSPVLNHVDISKTTGLSAVQGSAMSATKGSFTTLEMTSQQQMLPVHLPSISSSMYPLHSQHNQSHNYYPSSGGWPPVTGSGLLPVTPPNRIVFPGPGGFGLSSGRLPGFSLPHPSFQPLPSLLAASQIPSSHGSASVSYNGLTSSRLGEPQIGEVRFCTGVNLVHQEAKNLPQKEVSNGLSSSEVTSPQQDGISGNSPTHDTSAFSLFHFGGPAGVTKESDLNSVPLQEEIPRDSTMKDACVAQLLQSDITTPNDQAPIEEYSLFAVSHGNRFAFF